MRNTNHNLLSLTSLSAAIKAQKRVNEGERGRERTRTRKRLSEAAFLQPVHSRPSSKRHQVWCQKRREREGKLALFFRFAFLLLRQLNLAKLSSEIEIESVLNKQLSVVWLLE